MFLFGTDYTPVLTAAVGNSVEMETEEMVDNDHDLFRPLPR